MKLLKTEEKKESATKVVDKKISKRVFINLIIAITIMAYFCILSVVYKNVGLDTITNVVKVTTMVFLAISLILLEIAYKKESKTFVIHAFEILALAIHSLTTMHVIKINNFDFNNYILISSYAFSIYYVLKTIVISTKARKEFLNGLSDISEIVQKEEPHKKEASKKDKKKDKKVNKEDLSKEIKDDNSDIDVDQDIEEALEVIAEDDVEEEKTEAEVDEEITESLEEDKKEITNDKLAQLREKIRKLQDEDKNQNIDIKKENKEKEVSTEKKSDLKEQSKTDNKPKKRGRPKKVVKEVANEPRN